MKRLQIYIEEHLDEALAALALRDHTSKAALIRQFVAERLQPGSVAPDALDAIVGCDDAVPAGVDEVVYGGLGRERHAP